MLTAQELIVQHYGVKGMHWGVRKDEGSTPKKAKQSADSARAQAAKEKSKKQGTQSLSNEEMRHLVDRMNLEQRYSQMTAKEKPMIQKGAEWAAKTAWDMGVEVAKNQGKRAMNYYVAEAMESTLGIPAGGKKKGKKDEDED